MIKHSVPVVLLSMLVIVSGPFLVSGCDGDSITASSGDGTSILEGTVAEFEVVDSEMTLGVVPSDHLHAAISGVRVYLEGAVSFSTTTDDNGYFRFTGIPAGTYELRFEHMGETVRYRGQSGQAATIAVEDGTQTALTDIRCSGGQANIGNITVTAIPDNTADGDTGNDGSTADGDTGSDGSVPTPPPPADTLTDGLILHYSFDNDVGTTAVDDSGNGNDGTLANGPTHVNGVIGNGLQVQGNASVFSSAGQHVVLPAMDIVSMGEFTASLWVIDAFVNQYDEAYMSFGEMGGENNAAGISIHQFLAGSVSAGTNYALIGQDANSGYVWVPGQPADDRQALLWTLTYANGTMKLYKSGLLAGQLDNVVLEATTTEGYLARHVWWWSGAKRTSTRLNAVFDDVRVYNRALSASEVQQLHDLAP